MGLYRQTASSVLSVFASVCRRRTVCEYLCQRVCVSTSLCVWLCTCVDFVYVVKPVQTDLVNDVEFHADWSPICFISPLSPFSAF